jgi:hypothetical protein
LSVDRLCPMVLMRHVNWQVGYIVAKHDRFLG